MYSISSEILQDIETLCSGVGIFDSWPDEINYKRDYELFEGEYVN